MIIAIVMKPVGKLAAELKASAKETNNGET